MKLIRKRNVGGKWIIMPCPKNKPDIALFMHCNNGNKIAYTRDYKRNVEPLLMLHGVSFIETVTQK